MALDVTPKNDYIDVNPENWEDIYVLTDVYVNFLLRKIKNLCKTKSIVNLHVIHDPAETFKIFYLYFC